LIILVPAFLPIQDAPPPSPHKACLGIYLLDRTQADPTAIKRVAGLLAAARNPIMVAGGRAELETPRLPITVTVPNNGIMVYQKHAEDVIFGEHTDAVDFARPRPRRHRSGLRCRRPPGRTW
jgi:thiamine pyrophosphate-dependent acetolactate synthase large subunit-like protein